jgi:tetratricopeptide (TPR) repeat protein
MEPRRELFRHRVRSPRKGNVDQAITALERGLGLVQTANIPLWASLIASSLGYAYALSGQLDGAIALLY